MKCLIILTILLSYVTTILAEPVIAVSTYCQHYNETTLYLDKDLITSIGSNQYLLEDFDNKVPSNSGKLDYYIRYLHIAQGLCYYDKEEDIKPLADVYKFYSDNRDINLRYVKTSSCYYMYNKFLDKSIPNNEIQKIPCKKDFALYYNAMFYFIRNTTLCPYPQDKDMVSLGDIDTINNARSNFLLELFNLYESVIQFNEECYDDRNTEVVNCGFINRTSKLEYCSKRIDPQDDYSCCAYQGHVQNSIIIISETSVLAIVIGIVTTVLFLIPGTYFSIGAIRDIKTKKSIEEAVAKQEKMYQNQSPSRHSGRNSGLNSGYNSDNPYTSHSNYSSASRQMVPNSNYYNPSQKSNSQNRAIRSPQPLPTSPMDISNYNSNTNLLGNSNTNVASSSSSVALRPRVSSLYSRSSLDIASNYSLPLELPSSPIQLDRPKTPVSERPNTPIIDRPPRSPHLSTVSSVIDRPPRSPRLERPTTPILDRPPRSPRLERPTTPILDRPRSPHLSNASPVQERMSRSPQLSNPSPIIDRPARSPYLEGLIAERPKRRTPELKSVTPVTTTNSDIDLPISPLTPLVIENPSTTPKLEILPSTPKLEVSPSTPDLEYKE